MYLNTRELSLYFLNTTKMLFINISFKWCIPDINIPSTEGRSTYILIIKLLVIFGGHYIFYEMMVIFLFGDIYSDIPVAVIIHVATEHPPVRFPASHVRCKPEGTHPLVRITIVSNRRPLKATEISHHESEDWWPSYLSHGKSHDHTWV